MTIRYSIRLVDALDKQCQTRDSPLRNVLEIPNNNTNDNDKTMNNNTINHDNNSDNDDSLQTWKLHPSDLRVRARLTLWMWLMGFQI